MKKARRNPSESPVRKTRTDGSQPFYGSDARTRVTHDERGLNVTPAILQGEGKHVGDGLSHAQKDVNQHTLPVRAELPTSNQEGAELNVTRKSGGEFESESHSKKWAKPKMGGFKHVDPPAGQNAPTPTVSAPGLDPAKAPYEQQRSVGPIQVEENVGG